MYLLRDHYRRPQLDVYLGYMMDIILLGHDSNDLKFSRAS